MMGWNCSDNCLALGPERCKKKKKSPFISKGRKLISRDNYSYVETASIVSSTRRGPWYRTITETSPFVKTTPSMVPLP